MNLGGKKVINYQNIIQNEKSNQFKPHELGTASYPQNQSKFTWVYQIIFAQLHIFLNFGVQIKI